MASLLSGLKDVFLINYIVVSIITYANIISYTTTKNPSTPLPQHIMVVSLLGAAMVFALMLYLYFMIIEDVAGSQVKIYVAINGLLLWIVMFCSASSAIQIINA